MYYVIKFGNATYLDMSCANLDKGVIETTDLLRAKKYSTLALAAEQCKQLLTLPGYTAESVMIVRVLEE